MAEQTVICPNCGTTNQLTNKFCAHCGFDLTQAIAVVKAAADPQKALYVQAKEALAAGDFAKAIDGFNQLGAYTDAPDQLAKAKAGFAEAQQRQRERLYGEGLDAFSHGDLTTAAARFQQVAGFQDAEAKLALVKKAQAAAAAEAAAAAKQKQAADYDAAYRQGLAGAQAATTTSDLQRYLTYLAQFTGYQDGAAQLAQFQAKYTRLVEQEKAAHAVGARRRNRILIVAGVAVVIVGGGAFAWHSHQAAAAALADKVTAQRATNAKSYNGLPSDTKKDVKTMMATYHANPKDYIYKVKATAADYTVVGYTFRGPDTSKDKLPKSGTRVYDATAIYRR